MSIKKVIGGFAILGLTVLGTANLVSVVPKTVIAQNIETEVTAENTKVDINQVEFDSSTKFGARINTVFAKEQVKNEACGDTITTGKFDPNLKASVIKSIKTACITGEAKQSWLKLVWDNGLIGWVQNPKETQATVSNTTFEGVKTSGFGDYFQDFLTIKASANSVTCKNFTTQIIDLKILNQYPNLDLNDNGIGCDGLSKNPNDPQQVFKNSFDTDGSGRVNCGDFDSQVIDTEILTLFPRLDADSDGIGCESNAGVNTNSYAEGSDLTLPDIEINGANLEPEIDFDATTLQLQKALASDHKFLTNPNGDCTNFDLGCEITNSLAGLGNRGMWAFKFITGTLQGAGQSMVDVVEQVKNLVTDPSGTLDKMIEAFDTIAKDPKLLLKAFGDEANKLLNLDTLERANRIGQLVGGLVPDVVIGFATAGAGAMGLKALQGLKVSQKVASATIKLGNLTGKSLKLLSGDYSVVLSKVGTGLGITGNSAGKLVTTMDNTSFDKLSSLVVKENDKVVLTAIRNKDISKLINNFSKKIDFNQQDKHFSGSQTFRNLTELQQKTKSLITVSKEELISLVDKKAGSGFPIYTAKGEIQPHEIVDFGIIIGIVKDQKTGAVLGNTTKGKIHYSTRGNHVVPFLSKN